MQRKFHEPSVKTLEAYLSRVFRLVHFYQKRISAVDNLYGRAVLNDLIELKRRHAQRLESAVIRIQK